MKRSQRFLEIFVFSATLGFGAIVLVSERGIAESASTAPVVDATGNLSVPADYPNRYEYMGTWAVASDESSGSKEMHVVFASPGAIAAFRKDGHFQDGAVLVKEVREAATGSMTTGTVSHPTKLKGWFVAVRDSHGVHPDNKLWGDGWGWSWFDADKPLHTTSTDYRVDCKGCHVPAEATDWMYTSGYVSLNR
jgi:S-formylglutathione hydrolase FrmB